MLRLELLMAAAGQPAALAPSCQHVDLQAGPPPHARSLRETLIACTGERARNVCLAQALAEGNARLVWLAHNDFQEVASTSAAVHGGLIPAEAGPNLDAEAVMRMPGFLVTIALALCCAPWVHLTLLLGSKAHCIPR